MCVLRTVSSVFMMTTIRLGSTFWIPSRLAGLIGGGFLILLSMRMLPGEADLWGDILGANIANGVMFLVGLFILRWGLLPFPKNILQRIGNVLAWVLLSACSLQSVAWISHTGFRRLPVLYLAWSLLALCVASMPSLLASPSTPPRSQSGGKGVLGILACLPLLFASISLVLYRNAHMRTPVSQPRRILLWCDLPSAGPLLRCPALPEMPEIVLLIPYASQDLNTASNAHRFAQEAISKGYTVAAVSSLAGPVHIDKANLLMDWWGQFQQLQDCLVPLERTQHVLIPFWHFHEEWTPHRPEALLAETKLGFNPGSHEHSAQLLQHIAEEAVEKQIQLVALAPFLILDDLADADPGLQTALRISVLPPWEWSILGFPKDPSQEGGALTEHYIRSAMETLGEKVALVLDGRTYLDDPESLHRESRKVLASGASQLIFIGLDPLLHGDMRSFQAFIEGIRGPAEEAVRRPDPGVLWQRHLNFLLDLLVVGQRV